MALTAGSSVRGDYMLYWNDTYKSYDLGLISFITTETTLSAGSNTKTMTYTANDSTATYEILITPLYETGTSTGSW